MDPASTHSLDLVPGWNLAGNGTDAALTVGALYSDTSRFVTVWKWVAAQSAWAFYAPSLAAQGGSVLADYVNSKGYQLLTTVAPGEGYWVNAKLAASVALPSGNAISIAALGSTLVSGWNLVSLGQASTPKQFCDAQSSAVTTLWAWDALNSAWYFYAPSLDASGGLLTYINGKGYRADFENPLCMVHAADEASFERAAAIVKAAYVIGESWEETAPVVERIGP